MTLDHALMIAVIISTLAAPTIQTLIEFRLARPKASPEENQPNTLIHRIRGGFISVFKSLWFIVGWPLVFISVNIFSLIRELDRTTPITRGSVLDISVTVAATFFLLVNMTVGLLQRALDFQREANLRSLLKVIDVIESMQGDLKLMHESIALAEREKAELAKPRPGRLRATLNWFLGK